MWVLFLDKVVKEGLSEEVPFAQQHEQRQDTIL